MDEHKDLNFIESQNAINDAALEVPKALVEVWLSVLRHKEGYPEEQIARLENWITEEIQAAWNDMTIVTFDREAQTVSVLRDPVRKILGMLCEQKDLNEAIK